MSLDTLGLTHLDVVGQVPGTFGVKFDAMWAETTIFYGFKCRGLGNCVTPLHFKPYLSSVSLS